MRNYIFMIFFILFSCEEDQKNDLDNQLIEKIEITKKDNSVTNKFLNVDTMLICLNLSDSVLLLERPNVGFGQKKYEIDMSNNSMKIEIKNDVMDTSFYVVVEKWSILEYDSNCIEGRVSFNYKTGPDLASGEICFDSCLDCITIK